MSAVMSDRASQLDIELGRESGHVAVVCHDADSLMFVLDHFPDDRKQPTAENLERKFPCPTLHCHGEVSDRWICLMRFDDELSRARNVDATYRSERGSLACDSIEWLEIDYSAKLTRDERALRLRDLAHRPRRYDVVQSSMPIELRLADSLTSLLANDEADVRSKWLVSPRQCKAPDMPPTLRDLFILDDADRAIEAETADLLASLADLSGPGLDAIASQLSKNDAIRIHRLHATDLRERFFALVEKEKARRAALEVEKQAEQVKAAAAEARRKALDTVRKAFDVEGLVTFDRIVQFGRDDPSYRLFFKVGQREQAVNVKNTEQLRSRTRMEAVLGGALRTCIHPDYTQKGYHNVYCALLFLMQVVEVTTHDEQTASWIELFLRNVKRREFEPREAVQHMAQLQKVDGEPEFDGEKFALKDGESFRATDGRIFLNRADFVEFVRNYLKAERDERVISQRLAMIGFTQKGGKIQVKSGGKVYCRRFIVGRLADRE